MYPYELVTHISRRQKCVVICPQQPQLLLQ
jgi:hypothetical protein